MLIDGDVSGRRIGGVWYRSQNAYVHDFGMRVDQIPNEKFVDSYRLDDGDGGDTVLPQTSSAKVKDLSRLPWQHPRRS